MLCMCFAVATASQTIPKDIEEGVVCMCYMCL